MRVAEQRLSRLSVERRLRERIDDLSRSAARACDRERRARAAADRLRSEKKDLLRLLNGRAANAPLRAALAERPKRVYDGRCVYCGSRCHGRACAAHRDLVALDPFYSRRP